MKNIFNKLMKLENKSMKKIVMIGISKKLLVLIIVMVSNFVNAQIDRSMPEPGPAPEISFKEPYTIKLDNNLTVMVVVNDKLPLASATLIIDNPPILEGELSGVKSLLSSNMGKGNKFQSKDEFIEEKDFMGSFINYSSNGGSFSSLARYFERSMTMFAQGALYPVFNNEEFEKEKIKLIEGLKFNEKNTSTIARRVEDIIAYKQKHPSSEYTTESTVTKISIDNVNGFYNNYFKPNNAFLVVIGDVDLENTISLVKKLFGNWNFSKNLDSMFGENSINEFKDPQIPESTKIHVVDVPNASNVEITIQNVINRKMSDKDYFSGNVANRILGAGPESRLFTVIREEKGYAYGAYSGLPTNYKSKTKFQARTTVRTEVADSAIVEMVNQLKLITNNLVTDEELDNVKSGYFGSFAMSMEEPTTIVNQALSIITENLSPDFFKTFLSNINKVSKDEVLNSAKKFFLIDNSQIVVTGKIRDISEKLENIFLDGEKVEVTYYDQFGIETERPDYSVDETLTAGSIIDNYINAIGGLDKLNSVTSIEETYVADVMGNPFELHSLKSNKNQSLTTISVMGQSQKIVVNQSSGFMEVMGQKMEITGAELEEAIASAALFTETNLDYSTIKLVGKTEIDDEAAYEIKVSDSKSLFYSIETGLKLKEVTTQEVEGNSIITENFYNNYEEVEGILFPMSINLVTPSMPIPGGLFLNATSIMLNVETSDSDFE